MQIRSVVWLGILLFVTSINALADGQTRLLGEKFLFTSEYLKGERVIDIYIPQDIDASPIALPTVYVLDSNVLFDVVVSTLKLRWERGLAPKAVIVGVRARDAHERFGFAVPLKRLSGDAVVFSQSKPEVFDNFMRKELIPYIEDLTNVNDYRAIIGLSPTSTNVIYDYLHESPLFSAHIAMAADFLATSSFNHSETSLKKLLVRKAKQSEGRFLFLSLASEDRDNEPERAVPFDELQRDKSLRQFGLHAIIHDETEHYEHASVAIIQAMSTLFPMSLWRPNYPLLREKPEISLTFLTQFHQVLEQKYKFNIRPFTHGYWTQNSVIGHIEYLVNAQYWHQAVSVSQWLSEKIPQVPKAYYLEALALQQLGKYKQALQAVNTGLSLKATLTDEDRTKLKQLKASLTDATQLP